MKFLTESRNEQTLLPLIVWRAISMVFATVAPLCGAAIDPILIPGAQITDCRSALRVGVSACTDIANAPELYDFVKERQVTEYLAQYGKPPREAVRALLDPSDENIAAWIRRQRQIVSTASYVAARMVDLEERSAAGEPPLPPMRASDIPTMSQMRVTLFLRPADSSSAQALRALQRTITRYPLIEGRLVQIGSSAGSPPSWLGRLDTKLPLSVVAPAAVDGLAFPALLIQDLRYGLEQRVVASGITPIQIREYVVALRAAGRHRASHPTPGEGVQ